MLLVFLLAARLPVAPLFPTFSFSFHPRRNNSPNMTDIKDDDFNDLDDYDDDEPVADQKEDDAKKYARGTSSSLALTRARWCWSVCLSLTASCVGALSWTSGMPTFTPVSMRPASRSSS